MRKPEWFPCVRTVASGCFFSVLLAASFLAATAPAARASVLIQIDKTTQSMTVSVDGAPVYHFPVSTGRPGYDTPSGTFRAFRMEADHYSREWDDAPMPHSIFFTKVGHAIHGYLDTRHIGRPASHGCVRLTPENASKLYALVEREGVLNTTVVLTGQTPARTPAVAQRDGPDSRARGPKVGRNEELLGRDGPYDNAAAGAAYGRPRYGDGYDDGYGSPSYGISGYANPAAPVYRRPPAVFPFFLTPGY
jgi:hypothetical protein